MVFRSRKNIMHVGVGEYFRVEEGNEPQWHWQIRFGAFDCPQDTTRILSTYADGQYTSRTQPFGHAILVPVGVYLTVMQGIRPG